MKLAVSLTSSLNGLIDKANLRTCHEPTDQPSFKPNHCPT
ncbi:hypothetical protein AO385_1073 [Moraxella catarrhalis]|uniref:Uncharacterized protein n=1 Tax=Moraxella catarrhalis TaxID=480 RepID=A0A198XC75_MORCA|nr:hypothetical protein AO383_1590 [Moraxella catarrhalis]OAU98383.1 hypothetical protein AO384_0144 [Moraxella catarrhalis]OAV01387.1 hypothetical protein AO385_1073 [Moraxella catarrhalis]OAV04912.1 hypothetical protein AO379_1887 [Moraxella catarrhalis]OAV07883.1 hypothetical protein AO380_0969 [Moraxella catarrhalis]